MRVVVLTDLPRLYEETMYLNALEREMEKTGVELEVLVVRIPDPPRFNARLPMYQALETILSSRRILDHDIIHVQFTLPMGLVCAPFAVLHKRPVIIHTHGYDVLTTPSVGIGLRRIRIADFLVQLSWKATTRIIAVCKMTKREITRVGVDEKKVEVLYNGIDEELFCRRKSVEDDTLVKIRENNDLVLLNVGNLIDVKNQTRLLVAYDSFLKSHKSPEKTVLIICGTGPLEDRLRLLAGNLGLDKNVIFLGQLPHQQMPELYNIADVFVLSSLSEAHPWSLLEAMSCGLPVVASDVGGIPETLEDRDLLFNPWLPSDISKTITRIAEDPGRRRQVGAKNRRRVLERFTLRNHAANLGSIYHRACHAIS